MFAPRLVDQDGSVFLLLPGCCFYGWMNLAASLKVFNEEFPIK